MLNEMQKSLLENMLGTEGYVINAILSYGNEGEEQEIDFSIKFLYLKRAITESSDDFYNHLDKLGSQHLEFIRSLKLLNDLFQNTTTKIHERLNKATLDYYFNPAVCGQEPVLADFQAEITTLVNNQVLRITGQMDWEQAGKLDQAMLLREANENLKNPDQSWRHELCPGANHPTYIDGRLFRPRNHSNQENRTHRGFMLHV